MCSTAGFGLTTASAAQRAIYRIVDGLPLGDLACDEDVVACLGGAEAVASLPTERPAELDVLAAIRTYKSGFAAAVAIRATQTCDASSLKPGENARVSVVSLTVDLGKVVFDWITGTVIASKALSGLVIGDPTTDTIVLRHPSGRPIEIKVVAGSRAGGSLVARPSAGVIFDEYSRMVGSEDGKVTNFDDCRRSVVGRMLPGAQIINIGSPWAPSGPAYRRCQEFWGKPSRQLVFIRGTGPRLNPYWWTPERCERVRRSDPIAYQTDVLGDFCDPEEGLYTSEQLAACTRRGPIELGPHQEHAYSAAMDPATRGNAWTLVLGYAVLGAKGAPTKYVVALVRQWIGRRGAPLRPDLVLAEIESICALYGVKRIYTDQGSGTDALAAVARPLGLELDETVVTAPIKLEMHESVRTIVATEAIELPPDPVLRADLLAVRKRVTSNGLSIVLPKTSDGRHCDYAAALALFVKHAEQGARCARSMKNQQPIPPPTEYVSPLRELGIAPGGLREGQPIDGEYSAQLLFDTVLPMAYPHGRPRGW
jgi:hypothetical protein